MKCSNLNCKNYDEHATKPCHDCLEVDKMLKDVWRDAEAEERRRKIEQDKKHKKGGEG